MFERNVEAVLCIQAGRQENTTIVQDTDNASRGESTSISLQAVSLQVCHYSKSTGMPLQQTWNCRLRVALVSEYVRSVTRNKENKAR